MTIAEVTRRAVPPLAVIRRAECAAHRHGFAELSQAHDISRHASRE
jgi:hypothetical protein